jgi:hypothetical protein
MFIELIDYAITAYKADNKEKANFIQTIESIISSISEDVNMNIWCKKAYTSNPHYFHYWNLDAKNLLLANILYPHELNEETAATYVLYSRFDIVFRLILSAKYGNPLASLELSKVLEEHLQDLDDDSEESCENAARQLVNSLKDKASKVDEFDYVIPPSTNYPYWAHYKLTGNVKYLDLGKNHDNGRCCYELAKLSNDPFQQKHYYQLSIDNYYYYGYLGLASLCENLPQTAFNYYLLAGSKGIGQGYFEVAKLIRKYPNFLSQPGQDMHYFSLAGSNGYLPGYESEAWYYEQKGDIEKVKQIYLKLACSDPSYYYNCAQFYEAEDQIKYLKLSQPVSLKYIVELILTILDTDKTNLDNKD